MLVKGRCAGDYLLIGPHPHLGFVQRCSKMADLWRERKDKCRLKALGRPISVRPYSINKGTLWKWTKWTSHKWRFFFLLLLLDLFAWNLTWEVLDFPQLDSFFFWKLNLGCHCPGCWGRSSCFLYSSMFHIWNSCWFIYCQQNIIITGANFMVFLWHKLGLFQSNAMAWYFKYVKQCQQKNNYVRGGGMPFETDIAHTTVKITGRFAF